MSPDEAARLTVADFRTGDGLAKHLAPLRQAQPPPSITTGVALGIVLALGASDMLSSMPFGLPPGDPRVYATAAAVLFITGVIATVPPVLRALRIDPIVALRCE